MKPNRPPRRLPAAASATSFALVVAFANVGPLAPIAPAQGTAGNRPAGISARERDAALERAKAALDAARRQKPGAATSEAVQKAATAEGARQLKAAAAAALASRQSLSEGFAARRAADQDELDQAKAGVTPEAAEIIRTSDATPPPPRPGLIAQATPTAPGPAPATGGSNGAFDPSKVPVPDRVHAPAKDKPEPSGQILISASKLGYFDANNRIAIFSGEVAVDHPGFDLFCEHLEVHFKEKPATTAEPPAPAPTPGPEAAGSAGAGETPPATGPPGGDPGGGIGEIDFVVATGKEVKILKPAADGEMQIGKCKKAIYTADEGSLEMQIWPQAQRGRTLVKSLSEDARMVFSENGTMEAHGPHDTVIVKDEAPEARPAPAPGGP
jgi:hypothetical protein